MLGCKDINPWDKRFLIFPVIEETENKENGKNKLAPVHRA